MQQSDQLIQQPAPGSSAVYFCGDTVDFTLNFVPEPGTELMVVLNTNLDFIVGEFDNLAQGQAVALSYGGGQIPQPGSVLGWHPGPLGP